MFSLQVLFQVSIVVPFQDHLLVSFLDCNPMHLTSSAASVFFVFENLKEVKTVVRRLPKVGVGTEYGLPQSRFD